MLIAWSLVNSAIYYTRRQRLSSLLSRFLVRSNAHFYNSLICRRLNQNENLDLLSRAGAIYKVLSEPSLSVEEKSKNVLFFNEHKEIVVHNALLVLYLSDWFIYGVKENLLPFYLNNISHRNTVYFVIRLLPIDKSSGNFTAPEMHQDSMESQTSSNEFEYNYSVDQFAKAIGHLQKDPEVKLYECSTGNFIQLLLSWAEDSLFYDSNSSIEEIFSVKLSTNDASRTVNEGTPSLLTIEVDDYGEGASIQNSPLPSFSSSTNLYLSPNHRDLSSQSYSLLEVLFKSENNIADEAAPFKNLNQLNINGQLGRFRCHSEMNCRFSPRVTKRGNSPAIYDTSTVPIPNYICKLRERRRYRSLNAEEPNYNEPNPLTTSIKQEFHPRDKNDSFSRIEQHIESFSISSKHAKQQTGDTENNEQQERSNDKKHEGVFMESNGTIKTGQNEVFCLSPQTISFANNSTNGNVISTWKNRTANNDDVLTNTKPYKYSSFRSSTCGQLVQRQLSLGIRASKPTMMEERQQCSAGETYNSASEIIDPIRDICLGKNQQRCRFYTAPWTNGDGSCDANGPFLPAEQARILLPNQRSLSLNEEPRNALNGRLSAFRTSLAMNFGNPIETRMSSCSSDLSTISYPFNRRIHSLPRRRRYTTMDPLIDDSEQGKPNNDSESPLESTENMASHQKRITKDNYIPSRPNQKPPTLVIYTSDNEELFEKIAKCFLAIIPRDVYTVSHLSTESMIRHPWDDNNVLCLFIADTERLNDQAWARLQYYFVKGGKFIFICENNLLSSLTSCKSTKMQSNLLKSAFSKKSLCMALGKDFEKFLKKSLKELAKGGEVNESFKAKDLVGGSRYSVILSKKKDQPTCLYMQNDDCNACALFSDATTAQLFEDFSGDSIIRDAFSRLGIKIAKDEKGESSHTLLKPTPGYMICQKDSHILKIKGMTYKEPLGNGPSLRFSPAEASAPSSVEDNEIDYQNSTLPIEIRRRKLGLPTFNSEKYFELLNTKTVGQIVIYVPVCETTQNIGRSLNIAFPDCDGILVVAGAQINGKGRKGNSWLSPHGCALFTLNFNVPLDSTIGRSIGFLQHIVAVSVSDAVTTLIAEECPDFPLKIKWPNDLYYGRKYKLGGIIVQANSRNNRIECVVGVGLNVSNSKPTVCINDMLPDNLTRLLTVEEVIAITMNKFEYYVNVFVNEGKSAFCSKYYNYWMHTREEVEIQNKESDQREKVLIRGLDENGYLEVRSKQTGRIFSVCDDGNSFDLMKGLIHTKI